MFKLTLTLPNSFTINCNFDSIDEIQYAAETIKTMHGALFAEKDPK